MIEFSRLTVLILAELLVGLGLVTLGYIGVTLTRRQNAYRAAQQLVERIRHDTEPRSERLRHKLSGIYGYQGEVLEQILHDLNRVEKQLYQNIINGFLKRDLIAFQQIDVDVDNLVLAYQGLEPSFDQAEAASVGKSSETVDRDEIERLQSDNQRLSEELKVTMDTMARMISEYASMFTSEMGGPQDEPEAHLMDDSLEGLDIGQPGEMPQAVDPGISTGILGDPGSEADSATTSADQEASKAQGGQASLAASSDANDPLGDEVLEVADDFSDLVVNAMGQTNGSEPESEPQQSLVDELEQVDILPSDSDRDKAEYTTEPQSLEEEWARLLEEEARSMEAGGPEDPAKQS
jgi:hypothetical protein